MKDKSLWEIPLYKSSSTCGIKKTMNTDKAIPAELKRGIKVEAEHTSKKSIAKKIALHHLEEDPKYYTKLKTIFKH